MHLIRLVSVAICLAWLSACPAGATLTPETDWQTASIPTPTPAPFAHHGDVVYYNGNVIYAGNDGRIYAFDPATSTADAAELVYDSRSLTPTSKTVAGLFRDSDNYLYFHDSGETDYVYRVLLTDTWPIEDLQSLDTNGSGTIYGFAENPTTTAIYILSRDYYGGGNLIYIYLLTLFDTAPTLIGSFEKQHEDTDLGPSIFADNDNLLVGERPKTGSGSGYFHRIRIGNELTVDTVDYLTFSGGLADAVYGYSSGIYVSTGQGKSIIKLYGSISKGYELKPAASASQTAQGLCFDGSLFYVTEIGTSGAIAFSSLKSVVPQPSGKEDEGCFIQAVTPSFFHKIAEWIQ